MKPSGYLAGFVVSALCAGAWGQSRQLVCNGGIGRFDMTSSGGVAVQVGAVASGGFSTRACEAVLRWNKGRIVAVQRAAQVDIDVLGADLGFGVPVVAFEVRQAKDDRLASYQIWSLEKTPRLLETLTGAGSYRALDAGLNRHVSIWATDVAAMDDLSTLTHTTPASPPVAVFAFRRGRLVDVSAWYRSDYDQKIATLRRELTLGGRVQRRETEAEVLEIVWAYLYSGRQEQAWGELEKAWPESNVEQVKAAILAAYDQGIAAQATKTATGKLSAKWTEPAIVYQYLKPGSEDDQNSGMPTYNALGTAGPGAVNVKEQAYDPKQFEADVEPKPILLWRPPPSEAEQALLQHEETVLLTIDEAGKVHSAKMLVPDSDPELLQAAANWKFTPAIRDEKPVAYKLKLDVALRR